MDILENYGSLSNIELLEGKPEHSEDQKMQWKVVGEEGKYKCCIFTEIWGEFCIFQFFLTNSEHRKTSKTTSDSINDSDWVVIKHVWYCTAMFIHSWEL